MDKWIEELERDLAKQPTTRAPVHTPTENECPGCGTLSPEPFDFDLSGNDLFQCAECGIIWSCPCNEEGGVEAPVIVDNGGF